MGGPVDQWGSIFVLSVGGPFFHIGLELDRI